MEKLIVICGPTGTGKTKLAISLCKKFGGEIISADSRQVYVGADIGTNKINAKYQMPACAGRQNIKCGEGYWIQDGVKIYLYDVVEPNEEFSVAHFVDCTKDALSEIYSKNKLPFLVGGTGFWISAFLGEAPFSRIPPDWPLRRQLLVSSVSQLFSLLQTLDPKGVKGLKESDKKNKQRLIRYIELARAAGSIKEVLQYTVCSTDVLRIGLRSFRESLNHKANNWVRTIVEHGLLAETEKLLKKGYRDTRLLQGMIYAPAVSFIDGKIKKKDLVEKICFQLHNYIKRQMTWFKKDKEIRWFDVSKPNFDKRVEELVELFLKE